MTDKTMPTNIFIPYDGNYKGYFWYDKIENTDVDHKEYTLVHNNPDYYVIKKSDVDELDALNCFERFIASISNDIDFESHEDEWVEIVRTALIAQSDMVTIPRMLAESALECMHAYDSVEWNDDCEGDNYSETIYEFEKLLNYKAGE